MKRVATMTKKRAKEVDNGTEESEESSQLSDAPRNSDTSQIDDTNLTSDTTQLGKTESYDKSQTDNTKPIEDENVDVRDNTGKFCNTEKNQSDDSTQTTCTNESTIAEKLNDSIVSIESTMSNDTNIDVSNDTRKSCNAEQKESGDPMQITCKTENISAEKLNDSIVSIESTKSDNTVSVDVLSHCSTTQVINLITERTEPEINMTETGDTAQIGDIKCENVMHIGIPLKSTIEGTMDSEVSKIDMTHAVGTTAFNDSLQPIGSTLSEKSYSDVSLTSIEKQIAESAGNTTDKSTLSKKQRKWLVLQEKLKQKYGSSVVHGQRKEVDIKQSNIKDELVLQERMKQMCSSNMKAEQENESDIKQSNVEDGLVLEETLNQKTSSSVKGQEKKSEMKQSNTKDQSESKPITSNTSVIGATSSGFEKYLRLINILTKNPEKCQSFLQNQEQLKQKLGDKYKEPVIYSTVKQIALGHSASSQSGADKSTLETTNSLELLNVLYSDPERCKDWLRKQLDLKNELGDKYEEPVNYHTIKLIALHHSKVANANKSNKNIAPNTNIKPPNLELDTTKNPENILNETKIMKKNMEKVMCTKQNEINKSTNLKNSSDVLKKGVNEEKTFKENQPKKSSLSSTPTSKSVTVKNYDKTSNIEEDIVYVLLSPFAVHHKVHRMLEKQKQLKSIMGVKYKVPRFDALGKKVSYYHTDTSNWVVRLPFETTTKVITYKKDLPEIYAIDWVETQIQLFKKLGDSYKPQEYSPGQRRPQQEEVRSPAPDQFIMAQSINYYPEEQTNAQFFNEDFPTTHFTPGENDNNYIQPAEMYYNQPTGFYEASFYPPPIGYFGSVPQTGYYGPIDPSLNYQPPPYFNQPMPVDSLYTAGHELAPPGIGPPVGYPIPAQEAASMLFFNNSIEFNNPAAVEANTFTKGPELYNDIPLPPAHAINASIMATTNAKITDSFKTSKQPSTTKMAEPPAPTNAPIVTPKIKAADFRMDNCTGNIAFRFKGKDVYYPSHITNKKKRLTWVDQQFVIFTKKGDQYTPPEFDKNGKLMPQKIEQLTTIDPKTSKSALSKIKLPESKEPLPMEIPFPPSEDTATKKAVQAKVNQVSFDKFGMRINNELVLKKKPREVPPGVENLNKRKESEKSTERHDELRPKVLKQEKPKPSLDQVFVNKTAKITPPPEKAKIAVKLKKDEKKKKNASKPPKPVQSNTESTATPSIRLSYQNACAAESKPAAATYGNITYPGFLPTFVKSSPVPQPVVTPAASTTPPLSQPSPVQQASTVSTTAGIITGVPRTMANTWFEPTADTSAKKDNTGVPKARDSSFLDSKTGYSLYVGNIGPEIDTRCLIEAFAPFGNICHCYMVQDKHLSSKSSKFYGFVIYSELSDAESAMTTMNGQKLGSRPIQVNWAKVRMIPSNKKSESFTPPLQTPPELTTQISVAQPERTRGKSKLSAFERLGPPTEAKKPKLTINLMFAKDEKVEVVREVIEEHVPVYLRQDVIASKDVIVKEYLKIWPWARTVHVLRECTHTSRDIVLDEIEMSTYYSSKSAWIKVVVTGYPQHFKKEGVMDLLLKCVNAREFIPCFVEFSHKKCTFLLNRCEEALSYLHSNGLIAKKDNIEMYLKICQTNLTLDNLKFYKGAVFKTILSNNYDEQTKSLDLSSFQLKPDNSHFMYFPLNITFNQIFIMNVVKAILPSRNITTLNLSGNRLTNISSFNLSEYLPSLRILDLSNNWLPTVSALACFKGIPMYSLSLEGNPLCRNFIQRDHYIDVVKLIFPRLIILDGIRVDSKMEFKKNFSVNADVEDLVNTFLEIFFTLTDSNDRMQMESLYSENSVFSITCRPEMKRNPMYHNLKEFYMWCRSLNDRYNPLDPLEGAIVGGPKIVRYFTKWPIVAHDPCSFTVDVIHHTETTTILKVTGLFKIPAETLTQDEPVTEFSRTFALVTEDGIEYKIANDMMYISEATPERIASSFQTVGLQMRSMDALSLKFETPPDDDLKEKLAEIMMRLTSMKLKSSRRCLETVNWNLRKALEYFIRLEKVDATENLDS